MPLIPNSYGGTDLLATVKDLDKRLAALESKESPKQPAEPDVAKGWTPAPPPPKK